MKRIPSIKTVMTPFPKSIEPDAPIADAMTLMAKNNIHHLPVIRDGVLEGMVSKRDIELLEDSRSSNDGESPTVADILTKDTYTVDLSERLDSVLHRMAEHHLHWVVVTRKEKLVGIFTQSDACAAFAEYLREQVRRSGAGDAA